MRGVRTPINFRQDNESPNYILLDIDASAINNVNKSNYITPRHYNENYEGDHDKATKNIKRKRTEELLVGHFNIHFFLF